MSSIPVVSAGRFGSGYLREGEELVISSGPKRPIVFSVMPTGQWSSLNKLMITGPAAMRRAINMAARDEAREAAQEVKDGIRSGAPGGKRFARLSPGTINLRSRSGDSSSSPLMPRGRALVNAIVARAADSASRAGNSNNPQWIVGIRPGATQPGSGISMQTVARRQESGYVLVITPAARRAFFQKIGKGRTLTQGVAAMGAGGVSLVQVPARPFIGPVYRRRYGSGAAGRFRARIQGHFSKLA